MIRTIFILAASLIGLPRKDMLMPKHPVVRH
jgi:hypothetical protein